MRRFAIAVLAIGLLAPATAGAGQTTLDLPALVNQVMPSVVTVLASGLVQLRASGPGTQQASAPGMPPGAVATQRTKSVGSGFIVDPSGIVVTNNHVIDGADALAVTLADGTFLVARLLGRDVATDLALLTVDPPHDLAAVHFGDSAKVQVGAPVFAIGNPYGIGASVTSGIVSAVGRDIQEGPYDSFIQTDAPINRGNSGGPLFDMHGDVIGINSAIYSPSGGSVGISFAIPAGMAQNVIEQLREHGHVQRGWLGAGVQPMTSTFANSLGLDSTEGAIVAGVAPGSPADKAGLKDGDVILRYRDHPLTDARMLSRSVAMTPVGETVPVLVWRLGERLTLQATITEQPAVGDNPTVASLPRERAYRPSPDLGLQLGPLSDADRRARGIAPGIGVLIVHVDPASLAAERGIRDGDVIVNAEQHPVTEIDDVRMQTEAARKRGSYWVLLLIENQSGLRWIDVPIVQPNDTPR